MSEIVIFLGGVAIVLSALATLSVKNKEEIQVIGLRVLMGIGILALGCLMRFLKL